MIDKHSNWAAANYVCICIVKFGILQIILETFYNCCFFFTVFAHLRQSVCCANPLKMVLIRSAKPFSVCFTAFKSNSLLQSEILSISQKCRMSLGATNEAVQILPKKQHIGLTENKVVIE